MAILHFRPFTSVAAPKAALDLLAIGHVIDDAMQPGHFYVDPDLHLTWIAARAETIAWEIFRGRLLDVSHTRLQHTFLSWHLIEANATEPLISVKLDIHARQIHVTRGLLAHVWEGYDSGGGVIESREAVRWTRELVGTIPLDQFADRENLLDELICNIWQAIVGTSRLPLTSVEAPLPAFSFGQMHYVYRSDAPESPMTTWDELILIGTGPAVAVQETVKLLEFSLRQVNPSHAFRFIGALGGSNSPLVQNWRGWTSLWRKLFNSVSLSPQTCLVRNALISSALGLPIEEQIDLDSHLLRQLGRHLSAYDLVTFHYRGANYPDALLLDEVLKRFLQSAQLFPALFQADGPKARMLRRALRQACLMRRHYEGHLVPDLPTSPGENARVMPASHPRVPEEQLLQPLKRRRQLFSDEPLTGLLNDNTHKVLAQSVRDLERVEERTELGIGIFIDRPLGYTKAIGEPDLTPLLAHEAFSPSLARRRWLEVQKLCDELALPYDRATLGDSFEQGKWPTGLPHAELAECPRPTAALTDVRKVADDFVILRTLPGGLAEFLNYFAWRDMLKNGALGDVKLCVQAFNGAHEPVLALFDAQLRRRLEIVVDASQGAVLRAGVELPRAGLRVVTVWEDTNDPTVLARREMNEEVQIVRT